MLSFSGCRFIRYPSHVTQPLRFSDRNYTDAMLRWCVGSSGAEGILTKNLTVSIFETVRWTAAPPSVHPMLKLQSWRISVLIQMKRRIDRRCPHLVDRIIRCYCLRCSFSATHPTHLETGPSDHPMVAFSFFLLRSVPTTPTVAPMVPSVHPTVPFFFFSFLSSTCHCFNLSYLTCHHLLLIRYDLTCAWYVRLVVWHVNLGMICQLGHDILTCGNIHGTRKAYKDMLDKVVSLITCVSMNHQN
jgi:hypothetical protein